MDASQPNAVTPSETAALVENSTRTAYIDGISGDREAPANLQNPIQSTSAGPSQPTSVPENTGAKKIRKPSQGWFKLKK
jgi:hypothetical protein